MGISYLSEIFLKLTSLAKTMAQKTARKYKEKPIKKRKQKRT